MVARKEDPIVGVKPHSFGEYPALDVPTYHHEIFRAAPVVNPDDILFDDRSFIKVRSDVVRGGADELYAPLPRLMVRFGAFEAWQE